MNAICSKTVARLLRRVLVVAMVVPVVVLWFLRSRLFGSGTLQGGSIGRRIDNSLKRWLFYVRDGEYRKEFYNTMGYHVPACPEPNANFKGVPVLLSTFYTEILVRSKKRRDLHEQVYQGNLCSSLSEKGWYTLCLFQPLMGDWFQPMNVGENDTTVASMSSLSNKKHSVDFVVVPYLESGMDLWILKHYGSSNGVLNVYQSLPIVDRAHFWGLAMIWEYGGVFWGPSTNAKDFVETALHMSNNRNAPNLFEWKLVDNAGPTFLSHVISRDAKPLELRCLFDYWVQQDRYQNDFFPNVSWTGILKYVEQTQKCLDSAECCKLHLDEPMDASLNAPSKSLAVSNRYDVSVVAPELANDVNRTPKQSHNERMKQEACSPGWFCHRCLKMPWRGSLSKCLEICRSCYVKHITTPFQDSPLFREVELLVHINQVRDTPASAQAKRIPRIIHQTWFEDLSIERYPHLSRLQNSWKASGWHYNFYTDETARRYIQDHFPAPFVEAYDAVLPGAFKADFFRLLVLLREGGIYADIDVQLDLPNLDQFLPANVSFLVPRDVPIDRWPNSNFCLWNGFMAAAPGHPIIVQAVQDLLNRIQNRWDYYDVENAVCSESLDCEIWKLRSIPVLLLTGPCALGMSVNTALGRSNKVQGFDVGWLLPNRTTPSDNGNMEDDYFGHGLVLLADRYDLGELRFSDVDRAVLVASTDQDKLIKKPMVFDTKDRENRPTRQGEHYSKSETDVMGTSGVYVDNLVTNEYVKLTIHRHIG